MESSGVATYAPDWAVAPIKAQQFKLMDSPSERMNKMEQKAGGLPTPEFYQNLPDHTIGPVTYAEQIGKQLRESVDDIIAAKNARYKQQFQSTHGSLHLVA